MKKTPLTPITVTLNEAVRITGVSRSRFYKWIEAGLLSVRYNGSRPLLMFAELEAVIDGLPRGPRFTGPLLPPEDRALAKERAGEPDFAGVFADHLQRPSLGEAEARTRALAATIRAYRKYHECDFKTARAAVLALIERASEPEPPPTDLQQSDIGLGPPEPDSVAFISSVSTPTLARRANLGHSNLWPTPTADFTTAALRTPSGRLWPS